MLNMPETLFTAFFRLKRAAAMLAFICIDERRWEVSVVLFSKTNLVTKETQITWYYGS